MSLRLQHGRTVVKEEEIFFLYQRSLVDRTLSELSGSVPGHPTPLRVVVSRYSESWTGNYYPRSECSLGVWVNILDYLWLLLDTGSPVPDIIQFRELRRKGHSGGERADLPVSSSPGLSLS